MTAQLCQYYKLHHIKIADVIRETLDKLERAVARVDVEDEEEDDGSAQQAKEYLAVLKDDKEENSGRLSRLSARVLL